MFVYMHNGRVIAPGQATCPVLYSLNVKPEQIVHHHITLDPDVDHRRFADVSMGNRDSERTEGAGTYSSEPIHVKKTRAIKVRVRNSIVSNGRDFHRAGARFFTVTPRGYRLP